MADKIIGFSSTEKERLVRTEGLAIRNKEAIGEIKDAIKEAVNSVTMLADKTRNHLDSNNDKMDALRRDLFKEIEQLKVQRAYDKGITACLMFFMTTIGSCVGAAIDYVSRK